jgi:hypothetical protein
VTPPVVAAQAGLRLPDQHLADHVDLTDDIDVILPGLGRSPLTPARTGGYSKTWRLPHSPIASAAEAT